MRLNPLVMMRKEFDDTGIVFDPENNKAMTLNRVGTVIWESIENGLSEEQIADAVTENFSVERAVAEKDISNFLETLRNKGLLTD